VVQVGMGVEYQIDIGDGQPHLGQGRLEHLAGGVLDAGIYHGDPIPLEEIEEDVPASVEGSHNVVERLVHLCEAQRTDLHHCVTAAVLAARGKDRQVCNSKRDISDQKCMLTLDEPKLYRYYPRRGIIIFLTVDSRPLGTLPLFNRSLQFNIMPLYFF
jgi:hypothetical protein